MNVLENKDDVLQHWFNIADTPTKEIVFGTLEEGYLGRCKRCDYKYFFAKYLNNGYPEYHQNQALKANRKPIGVYSKDERKVIYYPTKKFPNVQEIEFERPCVAL